MSNNNNTDPSNGNKEATPGNNGESPKGGDSNSVPLSFSNQEDKSFQQENSDSEESTSTIKDDSNKLIQKGQDVSDKTVQTSQFESNTDLEYEMVSKFLRIQSIDEMRSIYGGKLVDLYLSRYDVDFTSQVNYVHMALEIEKIIKLNEVLDLYSVFSSLGYNVPDSIQGTSEQIPQSSDLNAPAPISRVPSLRNAETQTIDEDLINIYTGDISFVAKNHPFLLESDIADSADIVTANSPDSEGSTDYYPTDINNPF